MGFGSGMSLAFTIAIAATIASSSAADSSWYRSLQDSAAIEASNDAFAIQTAMEYVGIEDDDHVANTAKLSKPPISMDASTDMEDPWKVIQDGLAAWKKLVTEMEFDLEGAFRRRRLVPFTMIPSHIADCYGDEDTLSLLSRLRQAQEAFVYGVPLAAFALMRSILELILRQHYGGTAPKLKDMVEKAYQSGSLPSAIRFPQI